MQLDDQEAFGEVVHGLEPAAGQTVRVEGGALVLRVQQNALRERGQE